MPTESVLSVLDRAIEMASEQEAPEKRWPIRLEQLGVKLQRLEEEFRSRPRVPTALQDQYREQIDAISLENTHLKAQNERLTKALATTKAAFREEAHHAKALEDQLKILEQKLIGVLTRQA